MPPGHTPRQRLGAEPARDLDRLDQRLLVVEQRQHQRAVVRPAHLAEGVGRARQSRRSMAACGADVGWSSSTSMPGDGRPRRRRAIAPQPASRRAAGSRRARCSNRSIGIGAPRRQRPLGLPARGPARSAAARPCGRPAPRARPAARRRPGRRGERPARSGPSWRAAAGRSMPRSISRRATRSASSHSPARSRSQAIDRRRRTRRGCAPRAPRRRRAPARAYRSASSGRTQHMSE